MPTEKAVRDMQYARDKIKRIPLDVQKDYFTERLKPAADKAGEPVNTYIKNAIECRIRSEETQNRGDTE